MGWLELQFKNQHETSGAFLPTTMTTAAASFPTNSSVQVQEYEVVTTNYGWTTPEGKNSSQRIVTGEFFHSVGLHLRYNASAWTDLDIPICHEG